MPSPAGGLYNRLGIHYENKWIVYCFAKIICGKADSIRIEPPGEEGDGCELWLTRGRITEYHQYKRQHSRHGDWSISELWNRGVLETAYIKTTDPLHRFVFSSITSANPLNQLTMAASRKDFDEFLRDVTFGFKKAAWEELRNKWHPIIQSDHPGIQDLPADKRLKIEDQIVYQHLRHIKVRTIDEEGLADLASILRTQVLADPEEVSDRLIGYANNNLQKTIFDETLFNWLIEKKYTLIDYSKNPTVLNTIRSLNQHYENMIKPIANEISIPCDEVDEILDILIGKGEKHSVLVSGEAGIGKSFVLGQTIQEIRKREIPHLYFRVDRLVPTELPSNVGQQLDLPASPVKSLDGIAKSRTCVLIIDQLDNVSVVSGRNSTFFECIKEIIRSASTKPNMRLLMACRKFDLHNDNRLRELVSDRGPAQELSVNKFSLKTVKTVLNNLDLAENLFTEKQLDFLRLPLHLSILADIKPHIVKHLSSLASDIDLFQAYWEHKLNKVEKIIGNKPDRWTDVVDVLCEQMTKKQVQFVHEDTVMDSFRDTVRAMKSENVLVLDDTKLSFFHETFFDYAFARRFIAKDQDLVDYLKSGEQHLFKRAALRQILIHKFRANYDSFISDIKLLFSDPEIRYHIKQCTMEAIQRIDRATPELWDILGSIISDDNSSLANEVWKVFYLTQDWFRFLNEKGLMNNWLQSDIEKVQNNALQIIKYQIDYFPEDCAELLEPYVDSSPEWNRKLLWIIGWNPTLSTCRDVFDILLRLFKNGAFDDKEAPELWSMIHALPNRQPKWAAEILGLYLKHILKDVNLEKIDRGLFKGYGSETSFFLETAKNAPEQFLDNILPFFVDIVKATAKEREGKLLLDGIWYFRSYDRNLFDLKDSILEGVRIALRKLAEHSPEICSKYLSSLMIDGDYDSVNFLIIQAFGACSHMLSDTAVKYVSENPQRLEAGWPSGGGGDFEYWAAHEMIKNVSTSCSDKAFSRLEQLILNYSPIYECSKDGLRWRGFWQMLMLSALDPRRRSPEAEKRLNECHRKFPDRLITPPIASMGGTVHSPIPEDAASKMSDDNWLNAISKYNSDGRDHRYKKDFLKGNAHELSSVLQEEVKRDPTRFALLAQRFPSDTHPSYFGAIVRGLKDSDAEKDITFDIVRHFFNLPGKKGGHWICSLIAKYSNEDIPDDIMKILAWYATEANDPKDDSLTFRSGDSSDENNPSFILSTAINSVRGVAAEAVGKLLFSNAERVSFFTPYLHKMVNDPTITVRSTVAYALLGLYTHDDKLAVSLFLRLCKSEKDVLLATHHVDRFLYYAIDRHYSTLQPLLKRMLGSENTSVREAGARHTILAYLNTLSKKEITNRCSRLWLMLLKMITSKSGYKRYIGNCLYSLAQFSYPREIRKILAGDEAALEGAVKVAAANVLHVECHQFCNLALARFFNDPLKEIRDKAAGCFRAAKGRQLEGCTELIRAFLNSLAFEENLNDLIWPLKESTADISEVIVEVCEAVISTLYKGIDPYTRFSSQVDNVVELVLRAYQNSDDERYRSRCLNLIDKLLARGVRRISRELREYER